MVSWKLIVEEFGKIKSAEIEIAPLTLFVGDNNSGKSYLLSLIWGIKNFVVEDFLDYSDIYDSELMNWMTEIITTTLTAGKCEFSLKSVENVFEQFLNQKLVTGKDEFVKKIFNSKQIAYQGSGTVNKV